MSEILHITQKDDTGGARARESHAGKSLMERYNLKGHFDGLILNITM